MYVMQALPSHQQSLAGGIFNMLIRLGSTIAIGISTAVYSSVQQKQSAGDDPITPYRMAIFVSVGLAAVSCMFVPFLRIGTQGNTPDEKTASEESTASMDLVNPNSDTDAEKTVWENDEKASMNGGTITEKESPHTLH